MTSIDPDRGARTRGAPKPALTAALLLVLIVAGGASFCLSTKYLESKKAKRIAVVAVEMDESSLTAYRPSQELPETCGHGAGSPLVSIPFGKRHVIRDEDGKKISSNAILVSPDDPRVLSLTVLPNGTAIRVQKEADSFVVEGEVQTAGEGVLRVGRQDYVVEGALVLYGGVSAVPAAAGQVPGDLVQVGDEVRVFGYKGQGLIVDVIRHAGILQVGSNVDGARVYVDGSYRGKTPCEVRVSPGEKNVTVRATGYRDDAVKVMVEQKTMVPVRAELTEVTATLFVITVPPGADVRIGEERRGATPFSSELVPGTYRVSATLEGYYPKEQEVTLIPGAEDTLSFSMTPRRDSSREGDGPGLQKGVKALVLNTRPSDWLLEVKYAAGPTGSVKVEGAQIDGWPFTMQTLRTIRPGQELFLDFQKDGSLREACRYGNSGFAVSGEVMDCDGDHLWVGESWVRCSVGAETVFRLGTQFIPGDSIDKGDSITAYGASAGEIRFVEVHSTISERRPHEGFLVTISGNLHVVDDRGILVRQLSGDVPIADIQAKAVVQAEDSPVGSRIRYCTDAKDRVVWAEYVYRADFSVEGRIARVSGASLLVSPGWNWCTINMETPVFQGGRRTQFFNIKPGDSVTVAGPSAQEIRFVWVTDRLDHERTVTAVVTSAWTLQGLLLYEVGQAGTDTEVPLILPSETAVNDPRGRRTLTAGSLQPGDRILLWMSEGDTAIWTELAETVEEVLFGRYAGERDGLVYFAGPEGLAGRTIDGDTVIQGLFPDDSLEVGARVVASSKDQRVRYLEVQDNQASYGSITGAVIEAEEGRLCLWTGSGIQGLTCAKEAWFVDWRKGICGSVGLLMLGDRVTVALDQEGTVLWCERTAGLPFQVEGTVLRVQGRAVTMEGPGFNGTVLVSQGAVICKARSPVGVYSLVPGDKVRMSGRNQTAIDFVSGGD